MPAAVRLALAGAGRWGRNYIRTIASTPGTTLAAVASRNAETVTLVPPGCAIHSDWRTLLDPAKIDGLIVATPPATHAEIAAVAIERGLAVLIEKPLTLDPTQADALLRQAQARGAIAFCAHTHLFSPAYRSLKAEQRRFGAIREIHGEAGNLGPFRADATVLWDWGPHDVAMCLDLLGRLPDTASARAIERKSIDNPDGETVEVKLGFAGADATLLLSNIVPKRRRLSVRCERGTLVYDDVAADKLVVTPDGQPSQAVKVAPDLPLSVVVREFAAATSTRAPNVESLALGTRVVAVLAKCARSI